jgi:hypothetical protein
MIIKQMVHTLNKFSLGPSQEDEGQWKTSLRMDGTSLNENHCCPILAEPKHMETN